MPLFVGRDCRTPREIQSGGEKLEAWTFRIRSRSNPLDRNICWRNINTFAASYL